MSAPDTSHLDAVPDYLSRLRLDGRNFVVVGAGAGMGRQSAHALAQAGARVACVDKSAELSDAVATELEGATGIAADVTERAEVERAFAEAAERLGPVTGVVDVVGVATIGPLADLEDAAWDRQFDLVLRHAFLVLQVGAGALRAANGGTMTFVGSISGRRWVPDQAAYGAAKAALHQLVQAMGGELAADGIRVNAVAPGWVRTPRLVERLGEEAWGRIDAIIPRGSAALPAEIAGPLLFLSGDLSSYVTGHVLVADGGLTAGSPHPKVFN